GFFGEDRLCDVLRGCCGTPARTIVTRVVDAVHDFTGAAPQSDDITALALRYKPAAGPAQ
ncbi:MAG TPA: SpoIIE family protein phosphatase, partial [Lentisphaeria bacterium]|nr:SpoIIE family protein phosphatase [Lentisphaeria bacterium]